jgi:prepilin-type N-terminal cleavage/methylation domain-containing protein
VKSQWRRAKGEERRANGEERVARMHSSRPSPLALRPSLFTPRPSSSRGFTLVELVLSLGIIGVLTVAIGSAIVMAAQAIPTGKLPTDNAVLAAAALDQMQRDLSTAISFSERTATAATFTVADRTGDNQPETIRYALLSDSKGVLGNGASGTLWRTINGVTAPIVSNASAVALAYETESSTSGTTTYSLVNSGEQELASFTGWSGISASSNSFTVTDRDWIGQIVRPTIPANAVNLRITKVKLKLKGGGLLSLFSGSVNVGIHGREGTDADPRPDLARIGTSSTRSTGLLALAYEWTDFTFSDVAFTTVPDTLSIMIKGTSSGGSGNVNYLESGSATSNGHFMRWNDDSGDTDDWEPGSGAHNKYDTCFYVYGTYDTLQAQTTTTIRTVLRAVSARVQVGRGSAASSASGRIRTLNNPQVSP